MAKRRASKANARARGRTKTRSKKKKPAKKKPAKKKPAKKKPAKKKPAKKKPAKKKPAKKKPAKKKLAKKKPAKKKPAKKKPAKKKRRNTRTSKRPLRSEVDKWVGRLSTPQRRLIEGLRKLIKRVAPGLDEAIKWSQPVFSGRRPICYIMARSAGHVIFGFWEGKKLADPQGVLEGEGGRMRHVKLRKLSDLPAAVLEGLVKEAVAVDAAASA